MRDEFLQSLRRHKGGRSARSGDGISRQRRLNTKHLKLHSSTRHRWDQSEPRLSMQSHPLSGNE